MQSLKPLDTIVITSDIPALDLKAGDVGTVLDILSSKALVIEFIDTVGDNHITHIISPEQLMISTTSTDST